MAATTSTLRTKRSANEPAIGQDDAPFGLAVDHSFIQPIDGCRDAVPFKASIPQRGRLDVATRSVVITQRMGATLVLQRIGLNAYNGVAAQLMVLGGATYVRVLLRHPDPSYSILLESTLDLDEAVAAWRGWADRLCVPLLLSEQDGEDSIVRAMLGAVIVRGTQPRRPHGLAKRRPRYAKRRGQR